MTSDGGALSEKAVKPRRSANRSAASMVSPIAAPERAGEHARGAAPAEIGFERRRQRRAGAERRERGHGEARRLAEAPGFGGVNGRGPTQPSLGPSAAGPIASSCTGPGPRPASQRRPDSPGWPSRFRGPGSASHKSQRLDHLAASRPPQQGAPGDERVRRGQGEGAAGERRPVLDQAPPEP